MAILSVLEGEFVGSAWVRGALGRGWTYVGRCSFLGVILLMPGARCESGEMTEGRNHRWRVGGRASNLRSVRIQPLSFLPFFLSPLVGESHLYLDHLHGRTRNVKGNHGVAAAKREQERASFAPLDFATTQLEPEPHSTVRQAPVGSKQGEQPRS